ncbi:MAG TPA: type 1 glutamine amidotransferase [Draconibacterium sp.]|nr:type 1 glutamine amidotransferase [Draconibacterium sp.]
MNIHCLQHVPHERPGYIEEWAIQRNYNLSVTKLFNEEHTFPELKDFDLLVIMGGPMSVFDTDKYTWMTAEKSFVSHAIAEGKSILGICLGAQLIAHLLGANIKKSPETEIGWFPVSKISNHPLLNEIPDEFMAFHWHGEMFEIPSGAQRIFSSDGCSNQGFVYYDNVVGFQFHFETTQELVVEILANEEIDKLNGKYIQPSNEILAKVDYSKAINGYLEKILNRLADIS